MPRKLSSAYRYIRFSVSPPSTDALLLRKLIQDALGQSFGLVSSHTYLDILSLSEDGTTLVIRIGSKYVALRLIQTTRRSTPWRVQRA